MYILNPNLVNLGEMAYPHHSSLLQEFARPSFVLTIVLNPNLVNLGEMAYPHHSSLPKEFSRPSYVLTIVQNPNLVNLGEMAYIPCSFLQEVSRSSFVLTIFSLNLLLKLFTFFFFNYWLFTFRLAHTVQYVLFLLLQ